MASKVHTSELLFDIVKLSTKGCSYLHFNILVSHLQMMYNKPLAVCQIDKGKLYCHSDVNEYFSYR